jgi:hypothetical protein
LNRLWFVVPNGSLPVVPTSIEMPEPEDYALAYNPMTQTLHFGSETPEALTFTATVTALNGSRIGTFTANEEFSMATTPAGVYIVTWKVGGKMRSVKFRK